MKKHNFSAGPSILPDVVFQEAGKGIINYNNSGLSILEISHRSKAFESILQESEALVREILDINDEYGVIFLTGGASSQFFMTAMNLLEANQTAGFIDTGTWSAKAIKEAKHFGKVKVIASSQKDGYKCIPKNITIPKDLSYLHITSNNTVYGTQYHYWPETTVRLVGDMSSDIFTRPIDIHKFKAVYAGAQKNMGPAGTTLVIVEREALGKVQRAIPSMLDYRNHIAKKSAFNTPPVYAIYISLLNLRWLKKVGGIPEMQKRNEEKARLFYEELDRNNLFEGNVAKEDRSLINATFSLLGDYQALEPTFLKACEDGGCVGVKGHRSVGGFRASMYNALPVESVKALIEVMQTFEQKYG